MIDIQSVLSENETMYVEAKLAAKGIPASVWETYSSFANTFGGVILLGVEEDPKTHRLNLCGVSDPHQRIADLWNVLNNPQKVSQNILLNHHIYAEEYEGRTYVVMEVPRANRREKPVYIGTDPFRGSFRRNHEGDYHCSREEVLAMMRDQAPESVDGRVIDHLEIEDLNTESIRRYRTMFQNVKPGHVWTNRNDEEFLLKVGAAGRGEDRRLHPTLAGLLFFGDFMTIVGELPNYFLDYRERLDADARWSDRVTSGDGDWSGNIFDFYFKILDRLTGDIKRPFRLDQSLVRIDDTPIHAALREGLANALIHADYYGRCGIVIEKKYHELSISNPGLFRIGIAEAIAGGISDARNSRIFNLFSLIDIGERSGSGLCDIYHVWEKSGYVRPSITEQMDPDRTTLTLRTCVENDRNPGENDRNPEGNDRNPDENDRNPEGNDRNPEENDRNPEGNDRNPEGNDRNPEGNDRNPEENDRNPEENDRNSDGNDRNPHMGMSDVELAVLGRIRTIPSSTAKQMALALGMSEKTVRRTCKSLKEKGAIKREGSTRGKWVVLGDASPDGLG